MSGTNTITTRHIGPATVSALQEQLPAVLAPFSIMTEHVDRCTSSLNEALVTLLDSVAPISTKTKRSTRTTPWFTDETRGLKKSCRRLERKWRKSKLEADQLLWRDSVLLYRRALTAAKSAYYSRLISSNKHNPRFLFDTVAKLTKKAPSPTSTAFTAQDFLDFFCGKIDDIRHKISSSLSNISLELSLDSPRADHQLFSVINNFETISLETLTKLVSSSKCHNLPPGSPAS